MYCAMASLLMAAAGQWQAVAGQPKTSPITKAQSVSTTHDWS
jgi:hypothetical protein